MPTPAEPGPSPDGRPRRLAGALSSARRAAWLALRLLLNGRRLIRPSRVLLSPRLRGVRRRDPMIFQRILRNTLYFKNSSLRTTSAILSRHYGLLLAHFSERFIEGLVESRQLLWQAAEGPPLRISMAKARHTDIEAELNLYLSAGQTDLFVMGLVLVPAGSIFEGSEEGLLVSRVQGFRVGEELIRSATRSFSDIAPPFALICAAQALGSHLGIKTLYGVAARNQIWAIRQDNTSDFLAAYDSFWLSLGFREHSPDYYVSAIPLPEKPILSIRQKHRGRTLVKRRIKRQVFLEVLASLGRGGRIA